LLVQLDGYIEKAREKFATLEKEITSFDFSGPDQRKYEKLNREYSHLRELITTWDESTDAKKQLAENKEMLEMEDDQEFLDMIKRDIEDLEARIPILETKIKGLILPPDPNKGKNVIVEIRPAAGGDEAGLFAHDLYRMYTRFAEQKGWKLELLDLAEKELGGIKNVSFCVMGKDAFDMLILESGVHRVQRVPLTESSGRIHTSTVTVAVLAEAEEVEIEIKTEELRFDVYRSSGPGGQCVNTTDSAVRITHIPTGLFVASQQEKSQHRNKEIAMRLLRAKLLERKQAEEDAKNADARRKQVGTGDRSERIRTYNYPQNRITDHRFGVTSYDLTNILEGNMADFYAEIININNERRLNEELG